jgi:hypothetical protein
MRRTRRSGYFQQERTTLICHQCFVVDIARIYRYSQHLMLTFRCVEFGTDENDLSVSLATIISKSWIQACWLLAFCFAVWAKGWSVSAHFVPCVCFMTLPVPYEEMRCG